ncbi:MAG: hypothetical protein PWP23_3243 [Candidatus Sumerlaeota bacterium]|nr:hypothetical protein [Candidatus Sumerlaeota bacterium]
MLCLVLGGCAHRPASQRFKEKTTVETWKLDNGLTVFALESHAVPLVTLDMWVRVGSKDEPAEIAGISHYLEHMLFKGTPRLGVGDYDRRIEQLGGYLNAATSSDYTHYYMTLPSEHLDAALEDMADVLQNSLIDAREVERERSVILEEIRQKQDNPVGFLFDEVMRRTYESGPYAGTVIGSAETVAAMSREQLRDHYLRFYTPENMAFVVAGDFDPATLRPQLDRLLGQFRRETRPWRETPPETKFRAPEALTWQRDWQQTYFFLTFPGVAARDTKTMAALDVTEGLLFGGRSARLTNLLREKKGLVTSLSGLFMTNQHPGFLAIYGTCDPDKLDEIQAVLFEEIERLAKGGPSAAEMSRAKRQIVTDHLYRAETNTGKASLVGYSFAMLGNPALLVNYPDAVEAITADDVRGVLGLLARERASLYVARPGSAAPASAPAATF